MLVRERFGICRITFVGPMDESVFVQESNTHLNSCNGAQHPAVICSVIILYCIVGRVYCTWPIICSTNCPLLLSCFSFLTQSLVLILVCSIAFVVAEYRRYYNFIEERSSSRWAEVFLPVVTTQFLRKFTLLLLVNRSFI